MKYLVIIPARGGSKRIPGKNIKALNSKPLIQYTIEAVKDSHFLNRNEIFISTDSEEISETCRGLGCKIPFLRNPELATDSASSAGLVEEYLDYFNRQKIQIENIILLQPTSPLRTGIDLDNAIKLFEQKQAVSLVSVCESEANPYYLFKKQGDSLVPLSEKELGFKRSQDLDKVFRLNGAIYIIKTEEFIKYKSFIINETIGFEMPMIRSVDIDDDQDWQLAEAILESQAKR